MTDDEVIRQAEFFSQIPTTVTAFENAKHLTQGQPLRIPGLDYQRMAKPKPLHPAYPEIRKYMAEALDDILAGAEIQARLMDAAKQVDVSILQNNGYPPFNEL